MKISQKFYYLSLLDIWHFIFSLILWILETEPVDENFKMCEMIFEVQGKTDNYVRLKKDGIGIKFLGNNNLRQVPNIKIIILQIQLYI